MNDSNITELVEFIKGHTALSAIFGDRVQYVSFVNEPTDTNLIIRDLSENRGQVKSESLIEFRIGAPNKEIGPLQIKSYLSALRDVFETNQLMVGESNYYQVDSLGDNYIAMNSKDFYEGITSMIFKIAK